MGGARSFTLKSYGNGVCGGAPVRALSHYRGASALYSTKFYLTKSSDLHTGKGAPILGRVAGTPPHPLTY